MTDQDETNEGATPEEVPRPDVTVPEPTSPGDAPPPAGEVAGAEAVPPSAVAPPAEDVAAHEEASAPPPASPLPASPPAAKRVAARATVRKASPATSTKKGAAGLVAPVVVPPVRPTTLSIDIGGTGLKASVLDAVGKLVADRVRVDDAIPVSPESAHRLPRDAHRSLARLRPGIGRLPRSRAQGHHLDRAALCDA